MSLYFYELLEIFQNIQVRGVYQFWILHASLQPASLSVIGEYITMGSHAHKNKLYAPKT